MIALIFAGDLKYCPYMKRYIEQIEDMNREYVVYFWNRSGCENELPPNYMCYNSLSNLNKNKFAKVLDFLEFKKWVLNRIELEKPDKLIVLSTLTGIIMGRKLLDYHNNYIYDIRDYSYEKIVPYYILESIIIKNSAFTAISSKGFQNFLPKNEYVIAHNFNRNEILKKQGFKKKDKRIKFVWNGVIRYFEFQIKYLDCLKNDSRFEIIFHGDGPELQKYKEYCEKNDFRNIQFTGAYNNCDKAELIEDAGILNNCYGYTHRAGNKLKYAVSNRFYDGIIYHIPQLVEMEGYKSNWVKETGIGISLQPTEQFADLLFDYYQKIDEKEFDENCEHTLRTVINEDNDYIEKIRTFVK